MKNVICCKHRIHFVAVVVFFLCSISSMVGQLHCLNFTIQDGLPAENVLCATEDRDGFMWFGTSAGVCQFDGINFLNYASIGSTASPGGAFVKAIEIDHQNNLWVGTEDQGIYFLDRQSDTWTRFSADQAGFLKLRSDEVFCLQGTEDGLMWYGCSNGGLGCIDMDQKTHHNYDMHDLPKRNTWQNRVYDITKAPNEKHKLFVAGQGYVYQFDCETRSFEVIKINTQPIVTSGHSFDIQTIAIAQDDEIWMGTWDAGVKSFDIEKGIFRDIYPSDDPQSINWRSNVYQGAQNELWIADRQQGIGRYLLQTNQFVFFESEPFNRNGLLKGDYNAIYHSSQQQTWVLTSQGISLIVPEYQAFSNFLTKADRTVFFLDIDRVQGSDMYVASFAGESGPVKLLDKNLSVLQTAYYKDPPESFQSIFKTVTYHNKFICMADRLYEYDIEKNELSPYVIPGFQQKGGINDILVDDQGIWLLIGNGSLVYYDDSTHQIHEYQFQGYENTSREKVIYQGMAFVGDEIWVATQAELVVFNTKTNQFRYFYFDKNELYERTGLEKISEVVGTVHQIVPASEYSAWVVTSGEGIYLVSKTDTQDFGIVARRDKSNLDQLQSPVEMVSGVENDYWIATKNGLVHTDSAISSFKVYGQREGLNSRKLSQGITRLGDQLYIGMPKGFARFDTRVLDRKKKQAIVHIEHAQVDTTVLKPGFSHSFSHHENLASFKVATPIYDEASSVIYAHRLINHRNEWQFSNAQEKVFRYEKLAPGKYRFEVKAKSPGTAWSAIQTRSFTIRPPFWKTTWFRIVGLLALVAIAYLMYQLKLKYDLKKERVKTQLAELESQALRAQMNPHFIFNSLNSIKSLILLDRKDEGITYLTKFSRMVREILTLSKEKAIPLQKELELLGIYLDMESLRFHRKFQYQINVHPTVNTYQLMVPPLLIQPFAENSIWHGLLHKEGDAHLDISLSQDSGFLHIVIEDDGIGRTASAQIKSNKSMYRKSSEGLKLSRNRIDLISEYARVEIEDLVNAGAASGTRVTIKLPTNYGKNN